MTKLYYLGPEGSFSHILATEFIAATKQNFTLVPCDTFTEIAQAVVADPNGRGLLVVENSITSDVHEAVDLFFAKKLWIEAEAQLRISMNLVGLVGSDLKKITTVASKLPAIAQCSDFIAKHGLKARFTDSTSQALKEIVTTEDTSTAAIGARVLVQQYQGTQILAENIGNQVNNLTRFVLVRGRTEPLGWPDNSTKMTMIVELPHVTGSLAKYLNLLAEVGANLTRIESRPVPGTDWEYQFWIDVECKATEIEQVIEQAKKFASNFQLLGVYAKGHIFSS